MAEEWRLVIDFTGHSGPGWRFDRGKQAREVLRSRFGDDIVISAGNKRILLYSEHAGVAREAELAARQVLAEQGLGADVRLDQWDPADQVWRDARSDERESGAAPHGAGGGTSGPALMTAEMAEALASVIGGALDAIGFIP